MGIEENLNSEVLFEKAKHIEDLGNHILQEAADSRHPMLMRRKD